MDDVLDEVVRAARRSERAARAFENDPLKGLRGQIQEAINDVGRAWSGSWLGYQARVYIRGLRPRAPGEHFDSEWGRAGGFSSETSGDWAEYDQAAVINETLRRAGLTEEDLEPIHRAADAARDAFNAARDDLLPTIDALLEEENDRALRDTRKKIAALKTHYTMEEIAQIQAPKRFMSRDSLAVSQGLTVPPHLWLETRILEWFSYGAQAKELAALARYLEKYLRKKRKMKGKSVARMDGNIFIGHGRSLVWRELKDFVEDRLGLACDEYNQVSLGRNALPRCSTMRHSPSSCALLKMSC
jgi:hypothetical protein